MIKAIGWTAFLLTVLGTFLILSGIVIFPLTQDYGTLGASIVSGAALHYAARTFGLFLPPKE